VLIAPLERAGEFTSKAAKVLGVAQTSDHVALDEKDDITTFRAVVEAGKKAYKMAGVSAQDIQFAEVHDCFTIAEIIAGEDLGFVKKGEGGPYVLQGCTALNGPRPINTSGGFEVERPPGRCDRCRTDLRYRDPTSRRCGRAPSGASLAGARAEFGRLGCDGRSHNSGGRMTEALLEKARRDGAKWSRPGTVYTETLIFAAPEQFVKDAPYQLAIITLDGGGRLTARIAGIASRSAMRWSSPSIATGFRFFRKS